MLFERVALLRVEFSDAGTLSVGISISVDDSVLSLAILAPQHEMVLRWGAALNGLYRVQILLRRRHYLPHRGSSSLLPLRWHKVLLFKRHVISVLLLFLK